MANNNDNKNDMSQDQQRQRTGGSDAGKIEQPKGAPTAANRDKNVKTPPDKGTVGNDELNIDVGNEKTATRPPQPGTAKPIQKA